MPDRSTMRLGRIAPTTNRLSALPLFPDYASKLPPAPPSKSWADGVKDWRLLGNDKVGDCTIATVYHLIMSWLAANGKSATPTDEEVLSVYSAVTGYDPADPSTDQGAVMIDVLNYWRTTGVRIGDETHKLAGYARCRVGHHEHIRSAINLMGGVCLGVAFPDAWFDRDVWDVGRGPGFRPDGGHEIPAIGFSPKSLTVVSWGRTYEMTWAALDRYCEEVQVPVAADWADSDLSPSGFALDELLRDMGYLRGRPA